MAKEAAAQTQVPRERHLNIVYFIDSSRTHSIRVNLMHARWLLAGAIGLSIWSFLSLAWIVSLGHVLNTTRSHLSSALSSIFDYQVKYDKIFDVAYPDAAQQGYYAEGSHLPANNPITPDDRAAEKAISDSLTSKDSVMANPSLQNPPITVTKDIAATEAANAANAKSSANAVAAKYSDPTSMSDASEVKTGALDIRNSSLTKSSDKLNLEFDMINRESKHKAEGYVWAIIGLKLADGSIKNIVAPTTARLNGNGVVERPTSTYRFSIQRYKKKDFSFSAPASEGWSIASVKIVYSDLTGKNQKETIVPSTISSAEGTAPEEKDAAP